jgi:glutathione synthase/RimK-type ligase-like ATP-grasp enzyme
MSSITRQIGLSLGADICWPICYEEIMRRLALAIPVGSDTVRFEIERVTIEPFDLRQKVKYDVVIDRLTHWYHTSREWIKKAVIHDGVYVFNNPWSVQSMEKHSTYTAMMALGLPIPATWMIPPKAYEPSPDLEPTLSAYARLFDLGAIGQQIGYPLFMKPYDGGAWKGVTKIDDEKALRAAYDESGKLVMHLQQAVHPFETFVRCIGLGPQTMWVKYDPSAALHDRYTMARNFLTEEEKSLLADITLTINGMFGWDFNSCESLKKDGTWYPIDFANPCPDSQVTSLHYHFPWIVKSNIRWSVFCAATKKKMRKTLDWDPYFEIAERNLPYRERVAQYARVTRQRMEADRFEEFCARHLAHLDEIAWEFFGSDLARQAVRKKVSALFPEHEVEQFTDLFWTRIQAWRQDEERER